MNVYKVVTEAGYEYERVIAGEGKEEALKTLKLVHIVISSALFMDLTGTTFSDTLTNCAPVLTADTGSNSLCCILPRHSPDALGFPTGVLRGGTHLREGNR